MHNRVLAFFEKYSILSQNQFGFRKGKCCADAVSSLTEYLYESLNDMKFVVTIFVDLKKAYDTVNHVILLKKLELCGIRGDALKWFESYLSNRQQRVKIGTTFSDWNSVSNGVPQGSILGSLLFLIYLNDLSTIFSSLHVVIFSDDTCLSLSDNNHSKLISTFNSEFNKFYAWLVANRLSLNIQKNCIH